MFGFLFGSRASPDEARQLLGQGATLLDVRTPQEFAAGHVEGAVNIPVQVLAARKGELEGAKGVVVYCRSGMRSAKAARMLRGAGIEPVLDVGSMSRLGGG